MSERYGGRVQGAGLDRRAFLSQVAWTAGAAALSTGVAGRLASSADSVLDLGAAERVAAVRAPGIVTRRQWGADESLRSSSRGFAPIRKFIVHHTATGDGASNPAALIRSIYRYHTQTRGWDDIGYNFLIDPGGRIWEGRWARDYRSGELHDGESSGGEGVIGAHARDHNTGSVGIAFLGTYTGGTRPTRGALEALVNLVAWKCAAHGVDPQGASGYTNGVGLRVSFPNIAGHRNVGQTGCPGTLMDHLPWVRTKVALRIGHGLIGYRILRSDGNMAHLGGAADLGNPRVFGARSGLVDVVSPTDRQGYWAVHEDGGVLSFGLPFHGSAHGLGHGGIVDVAPARNGKGYGLVSRHGGVYAFGDFPYHGSAASVRIVGSAVSLLTFPDGSYSVVTDAGGVYAFGGAPFRGSATDYRHGGIADAAPDPRGRGYWLLSRNGGVYAFGVPYYGNMDDVSRWIGPARRIVPSPSGRGYLILAANGGVYAFGDAAFHGSDARGARDAVALAPVVRV